MEFITENYVWFIVGGIVLIMAVIGYIADKTDFGRKRDEEKEKKQPQPEPLKVEAKGISEITNEVNEHIYGTNNVESVEDVVEDVQQDTNTDDVIPVIDSNEVVDETLFAPLEPAAGDDSNDSDSNEISDQENSQPSLDDEDVWNF